MKKAIAIVLLVITVLIIYVLWADKAITEREFEIRSEKIPSSFESFRIAHVSDLHNASFGKDNKKLLEKLRKIKPDIIAVTGDVVDSRRTDTAVALDFMKNALEIAPVYYVTGNHEYRLDDSRDFTQKIEALGIKLLDNESISINKNGEAITLCGISDPYFYGDYLSEYEGFAVSQALDSLEKNEDYRILLSHRPEFFDIYTEYALDLVLSGHAHGGQFRLPFIGGLIAPGQGLFPEYDSGLYEKESTKMLVSRGLGNSIIPLRLFNRPEIITVILKSK